MGLKENMRPEEYTRLKRTCDFAKAGTMNALFLLGFLNKDLCLFSGVRDLTIPVTLLKLQIRHCGTSQHP